MLRQNATGLQWIASEAWTAAAVLQTPLLMPYLGGTLGIAIRRGEIPGLREFLAQIRPDRNLKTSRNNMVRDIFSLFRLMFQDFNVAFSIYSRSGSFGRTHSNANLIHKI